MRYDDPLFNEVFVHVTNSKIEQTLPLNACHFSKAEFARMFFNFSYFLPKSSKLLGTKAPASAKALFLALAVSEVFPALAPA